MRTQKNKTPLFVLISDVHYSLSTLPLAAEVFNQALDTAEKLNVPLIDAGDLTNDKAILRAEVVNSLIDTMVDAKTRGIEVLLLVGNHSLINEKGKAHALNFLAPYATLVDSPRYIMEGVGAIPYCHDPVEFLTAARSFPKGTLLIGHQGTLGGLMGDYVIDPSAIDPENVADYPVFLGHYHNHYTNGTTVSIGNPYTLTFGEAATHTKGYLVVYSDHSYDHVPTKMRKHVIAECTPATVFDPVPELQPNDLLWVKVTGPYSELEKLDKQKIGQTHIGHSNFKLDKIVSEVAEAEIIQVESQSAQTLFDLLIDQSSETSKQKTVLKSVWRSV